MNCVNIAEYFVRKQFFAQAEYCLLSAFAILPEDQTKKKKLRATLQMQFARYYLERLTVGGQNLRDGVKYD